MIEGGHEGRGMGGKENAGAEKGSGTEEWGLSVRMSGVMVLFLQSSMLSLAFFRALTCYVFSSPLSVYSPLSARSQAQLKAGISGVEAREAEEAFFRQHPHFKGCDPKLFGVTNLTNRSACVGVP